MQDKPWAPHPQPYSSATLTAVGGWPASGCRTLFLAHFDRALNLKVSTSLRVVLCPADVSPLPGARRNALWPHASVEQSPAKVHPDLPALAGDSGQTVEDPSEIGITPSSSSELGRHLASTTRQGVSARSTSRLEGGQVPYIGLTCVACPTSKVFQTLLCRTFPILLPTGVNSAHGACRAGPARGLSKATTGVFSKLPRTHRIACEWYQRSAIVSRSLQDAFSGCQALIAPRGLKINLFAVQGIGPGCSCWAGGCYEVIRFKRKQHASHICQRSVRGPALARARGIFSR